MKDDLSTIELQRAMYLFSNMPKNFNDGGDEFRWPSIFEIPDCQKYNINYQIFPEFTLPIGKSNCIRIILPIWEVLSSLKNDALLLRTFRWDRVKSQLSNGTIEYPEVCFDDGSPIQDLLNPTSLNISGQERLSLLDGRHRLVALMRFYKAEEAPFICEPNEFEKIIQFLDKKKIKYSLI